MGRFDRSAIHDGVGPAPLQLVPAVGSYLTDGTHLLRIECVLKAPDGDTLVEVEDCSTLDHYIVTAGEFHRQGVRRVEPLP